MREASTAVTRPDSVTAWHHVVAWVFLAGLVAAQAFSFRALDEPLLPGIGPADAVADFNGDGNADLLWSTGVFVGDGHANFVSAPGLAQLAFARLSARAADLNGDGL